MFRLKILSKFNISNPQPGQWFKQQDWLDAFKEIATTLGPTNLRFIGKAIIKSAQFPPIETNKQAYEIVDIAYHMNHKDGEIGYYKLISYDENNKTAIMETNNPYPNDFDSGIFLGVFEKQRPPGGYSPTVTYLETDNGKVEFTIKWS